RLRASRNVHATNSTYNQPINEDKGCAALKRVIVALLLASSAFGCFMVPRTYKVPLSFSVLVRNGVGPVVGLKLRLVDPGTQEFLKLSDEQQRKVDAEQFVRVVAESVTDARGQARFG